MIRSLQRTCRANGGLLASWSNRGTRSTRVACSMHDLVVSLCHTLSSWLTLFPLTSLTPTIFPHVYQNFPRFASRDLIKSLIAQGQAADKAESIQIAAELLASKLIFPTQSQSSDTGVKVRFSKKLYYSISEEIAIVANRTQRTLSRVQLQVLSLRTCLWK